MDRSQEDEKTSFSYIAQDAIYTEEKPFEINMDLPPTVRHTNINWQKGPPETVANVRGKEDHFTLDRNGFCFVKHESAFSAWGDQEATAKVYIVEMEQFIKEHVDEAHVVTIYDWRMRKHRREKEVEGRSHNLNDRTETLHPAFHVHTDLTASSVIRKVQQIHGADATKLLAGRVRTINVWRPIKHAVYDCPLALCDSSTMSSTECLEADRIRKNEVSTLGVCHYRPGRRWYYMREQNEDEVVIFKSFDSADVAARYCMHAAFQHQVVPEHTPCRESIEVRALVVTIGEEKGRVSIPPQLAPINPAAMYIDGF